MVFLKVGKKVEAIRHALFSTAYRTGAANEKDYFGKGIVQAHDAMQVPVKKTGLVMQEADTVRFPIFNVLFKGPTKAMASPGEAMMIELEINQRVSESLVLQKLLGNKDYTSLSAASKKKFRDIIIADPDTSVVLRKYLMTMRS